MAYIPEADCPAAGSPNINEGLEVKRKRKTSNAANKVLT